MIKGGVGGANTNKTGLKFEKDTDLKKLFESLKGYSVKGEEIHFDGLKVAEMYAKNKLYKDLLSKHNIDWKSRASCKLLPDEAILILKDNTLFQTCDFKKKKYLKLLAGTNIKIEFAYVLNDWFNQKRNKDTFDYIKSVGCNYFFNTLPLSFLGLPTPI
jgi:hypothetical protein